MTEPEPCERWYFSLNRKRRVVQMQARGEGPGGMGADFYRELRAGDRSRIKGASYRRLASLKNGSFVNRNGRAVFDERSP